MKTNLQNEFSGIAIPPLCLCASVANPSADFCIHCGAVADHAPEHCPLLVTDDELQAAHAKKFHHESNNEAETGNRGATDGPQMETIEGGNGAVEPA